LRGLSANAGSLFYFPRRILKPNSILNPNSSILLLCP